MLGIKLFHLIQGTPGGDSISDTTSYILRSGSRRIRVWNCSIALIFDMHLGSDAVEALKKFQSDTIIFIIIIVYLYRKSLVRTTIPTSKHTHPQKSTMIKRSWITPTPEKYKKAQWAHGLNTGYYYSAVSWFINSEYSCLFRPHTDTLWI